MLRLLLPAVLGVLLALVACDTTQDNTSPGCSDPTACTNGAGAIQACYTRDAKGACATLYYQVGAQVFHCNSCTDQSNCANVAAVACGVPGASLPADASVDASHD
jgi:hypothetical protein